MSTSFSSIALIGSKVDRDKLFIKEKIRGCSCDIPKQNAAAFIYCPVCGKHIWREVETRIFDEEWELDGLQIVSSTDQEEFFVGYYVAQSWASQNCQMTKILTSVVDILQCVAAVKAALSKIDAWDESKFGLWAVPYISY